MFILRNDGPSQFLPDLKESAWVGTHPSSSSMTLTEAYSSAQEKMRTGDLRQGYLRDRSWSEAIFQRHS